MTLRKYVKLWGAAGAPNFFFFCPNFFYYFALLPPPKAVVSKLGAGGAPTGAPKAPKGGAHGATEQMTFLNLGLDIPLLIKILIPLIISYYSNKLVVSQLRICKSIPPPLLRSGHLDIKEAQCAETKDGRKIS